MGGSRRSKTKKIWADIVIASVQCGPEAGRSQEVNGDILAALSSFDGESNIVPQRDRSPRLIAKHIKCPDKVKPSIAVHLV